MNKIVRFRQLRTVTHHYVSDTIALSVSEFAGMDVPSSAGAFAQWIADHAPELMVNPHLSEMTRMKLSKMGFYTEERARRVDAIGVEMTCKED
jgi:hypothetical protein